MPPCRRELLASAWRKISNTCGKNSGAIPCPLSSTINLRLIAFLVQRDFDLAIGRRKFHRVVKKVPGDLAQPNRVAFHYQHFRIEINVKSDPFGSASALTVSIASVITVDKRHGLPIKRKFAHLQARQIKQVGNQLRLGQRIAANGFRGFNHKRMLLRLVAAPQYFRVANDDVQRISQLMRKRGQKFVLQPIGVFRLGACFAFSLRAGFPVLLRRGGASVLSVETPTMPISSPLSLKIGESVNQRREERAVAPLHFKFACPALSGLQRRRGFLACSLKSR